MEVLSIRGERLLVPVLDRMQSRSENFNACEKLRRDASQFARINWPNEGIGSSYFHKKTNPHPRLGGGLHAIVYKFLDPQFCKTSM